ncbi:hypothetical protein IZU99_04505 [Oscillospiraceae bacterium CM]|nr:hypothetical protein IZU99_04505 [Oscillospiraceae bacterium CM]
MKKITQNRNMLFFISLISFVILAGAAYISIDHFAGKDTIPTYYVHALYPINREDKQITVGDADYVFVGYVDKLVNTIYKYPLTIETENGTKTVTSPYTNYYVTVLKNIKGNLQTNVSIPVQKNGGISEDGSMYIIPENDVLPQVNNTYIFLVYVQEDGTILVTGVNSNVKLDISNRDKINISSSQIISTKGYSDYVWAYNNEKSTNRVRFNSKYEVTNQK